eukprot:2853207-Ditylum_brightwellii.AAC.1
MLKELRKRVKMKQERVIKRKLSICPLLYSNIESKYRQETWRLVSLAYMEQDTHDNQRKGN